MSIAWPLAVLRAQQAAMPIIGYVHPGSLDGERPQVDAFHRALREAGYTEGQNARILQGAKPSNLPVFKW